MIDYGSPFAGDENAFPVCRLCHNWNKQVCDLCESCFTLHDGNVLTFVAQSANQPLFQPRGCTETTFSSSPSPICKSIRSCGPFKDFAGHFDIFGATEIRPHPTAWHLKNYVLKVNNIVFHSVIGLPVIRKLLIAREQNSFIVSAFLIPLENINLACDVSTRKVYQQLSRVSFLCPSRWER